MGEKQLPRAVTVIKLIINNVTLIADLENCMMNNGITSVVSDIPNGICMLKMYVEPPSLSLEKCKTGCLDASRCYAIDYSSKSCIEYMYQKVTSKCYFGRETVFINHKGMVFRCLASNLGNNYI